MYSTNINIYQFSDFRKFLSEVVEELRKSNAGFSFRRFSKIAGFSSPNFLLLLIQGERNLSTDSADKISKAFSLDQYKSQFFKFLVGFNQSKSLEEKSHYVQKMKQLKIKQNIEYLHQSHFDYYSSWINIVVRELIVTKPGIQVDEIVQLILPQQKKSDIEKSIDILKNLDLIQSKDGYFFSTQKNLKTGDQFTSVAVYQFHRQMIQNANEALNNFPREQRNISSVSIAIDSAKYEKIVQKINELREEIMILSSEETNTQLNTKIYQFNFQLFPLTQEINKENL